MTGFIGVGQLRYILTNLGEKMSDDEVDELLKAVDTSSGEINYTGMFALLNWEREGKVLIWWHRSRSNDPRELDNGYSWVRKRAYLIVGIRITAWIGWLAQTREDMALRCCY